MKRKIVAIALLLFAAAGVIFLIAKNSPGSNQGNKLDVYASFYPLYNFAQNIGGEKINVSVVTPAGAEPHDYEPSASLLAKAQKSKVFIYNGGTFEPWTDDFIKDYSGTLVMGGSGISLQKNNDPHFWLDPVLAEKMVANIRDGLIKADPANKEYYTNNAAAYIDKLKQLDQEFAAGLATCQGRTVVTSHTAFGYLGARYDLTIHAIAGVDPEQEPSPAKMAELSQIVKDDNIKYIFFERLVSPKLADTIASETGAKTLVLDPIEGVSNEDQRKGKDYISIQRENLANLRTALSCR